MARSHHKLGCLCCGKRRRTDDIISKKFDVYLKDSVSNSLMRVGLCEDCFNHRDEHCLDAMKSSLEESEIAANTEQKKPECETEKFKCAHFTGRMAFSEYWEKASKVSPKTASEFLGIIPDERN